MADVLETIKTMIRQGASSDEIVDTLRTMGISEDEARKLILLAERDMLRVLRNEIREIAADAFDERAEVMKKDILADVNHRVDVQLKLAQKTLMDMIRTEMNKYVSSLSRIEERVSLLEKKMYDIETEVSRLQTYKPRRNVSGFLRYVLPIVGAFVMGTGAFIVKSNPQLQIALFIAGIVLVVGGILFG